MVSESQAATWAAVLTAADLNPWGGPGPGFFARRRAWLHRERAVSSTPPGAAPRLPSGAIDGNARFATRLRETPAPVSA